MVEEGVFGAGVFGARFLIEHPHTIEIIPLSVYHGGIPADSGRLLEKVLASPDNLP